MEYKGSSLTSLLLVAFFAEVTKVNAKAFNIKSCQPRQKHCRGKAEAKMYFHLVTSAFSLPQQKMMKFEGCILGHFLHFDLPNNQKNQHFKRKRKKTLQDIILNLCTTNDNHMMYGS